MAKQSPYQKYGKTPFRYEYPHCRHSRSVFQATAVSSKDQDNWQGLVCAACNIIIEKLSSRRDAARAA